MEIWTIIIIIAIVLIVLFAFRPRIEQYWMRGRGDQRQGGGSTDISGDRGTDIGTPGSGTTTDVGAGPSGNWSSIDEQERRLGEQDEEERGEDQLPRL